MGSICTPVRHPCTSYGHGRVSLRQPAKESDLPGSVKVRLSREEQKGRGSAWAAHCLLEHFKCLAKPRVTASREVPGSSAHTAIPRPKATLVECPLENTFHSPTLLIGAIGGLFGFKRRNPLRSPRLRLHKAILEPFSNIDASADLGQRFLLAHVAGRSTTLFMAFILRPTLTAAFAAMVVEPSVNGLWVPLSCGHI